MTSIDQIEPTLAAPWARETPFWVLLGVVFLAVLGVVFYVRYQNRGSLPVRVALAVSRALLLVLLFITLADPALQIRATHSPRPLLYVLFDGTDSMAIEDQYSAEETKALQEAVAYAPQSPGNTSEKLSRLSYIQSLVKKPKENLLAELQKQKDVQIEAFVFDGNTTSQLRKLSDGKSSEQKLDTDLLAEQLSTKGQVTALGAVMNDVTRQFGAGKVAGVIMVSDFAHNSGAPPLGAQSGEISPLEKLHAQLGVPVYTVGIGATEAKDLALDLQVPPRLRKAKEQEKATELTVTLDQTGYTGAAVKVTLTARKVQGSTSEGASAILVGEKTVLLSESRHTETFSYRPQEAGRFEFEARVEKQPEEVIEENNRATRETNVIDDYMRLMYVAYEPDWEWRFIKETFQKHPDVGVKGFRTYLDSSDPKVRESNELFLSTLTPKRSEFFKNDIIFLGDMPNARLNPRFCKLVKEFVGDFGGGLVIIAGPRFGPRQLLGTELADMLPVALDPEGKLRDDKEFTLQLTPEAESPEYAFMRLAQAPAENRNAWKNLGKLPWYQPVERLVEHRRAAVLAVHPTDKCKDGKTPQPIIALGNYGANGGQVLYVGFNEMWRLRKQQGDKLYEPFWWQLMNRLTIGHAQGDQKRFQARTSLKQCRVGDKVALTVEAYDANYERLTEDKVPGRVLVAEHIIPEHDGQPSRTASLEIPMRSPGVFELKLDVDDPGRHLVRVKSPLTSQFEATADFSAEAVSAERRVAVRDKKLQDEIAAASGGKSYELTNVSNLVKDLRLEPKVETSVRNYALWSTPFWFGLVVLLMLAEWFCRKLVHLT